MNEQSTNNCSKCNIPTGLIAWYCCNPDVYFCQKCAQIKCRICKRLRTKCHRNKTLPPQKKKCVNCDQLQTKQKAEYFYEQKCKQYYCRDCILIFFQKYRKMINIMKKQYGEAPQMDVQLRCGCEIQKESIVEYIKKYCYCCSQKIQSEGISFKSGYRFKTICYNHFKQQMKGRKNRQEQGNAHISQNENKGHEKMEGIIGKEIEIVNSNQKQQKQEQAQINSIIQKQSLNSQQKPKVKSSQNQFIGNMKQTNEKLNFIYEKKQHQQTNSEQDEDNIEYSNQFRKLKMFTLNYNQKQEQILQCNQCKTLSIEQSIFRIYCLQPSQPSTIRISETQQELLKYTKQENIKIYCKNCYVDLKMKLKIEEKFKRYSQNQFSYSVPKIPKAPKVSKIPKKQIHKLVEKSDDYSFITLRILKKFLPLN